MSAAKRWGQRAATAGVICVFAVVALACATVLTACAAPVIESLGARS